MVVQRHMNLNGIAGAEEYTLVRDGLRIRHNAHFLAPQIAQFSCGHIPFLSFQEFHCNLSQMSTRLRSTGHGPVSSAVPPYSGYDTLQERWCIFRLFLFRFSQGFFPGLLQETGNFCCPLHRCACRHSQSTRQKVTFNLWKQGKFDPAGLPYSHGHQQDGDTRRNCGITPAHTKVHRPGIRVPDEPF